MANWVRRVFSPAGTYSWVCPAGVTVVFLQGVGGGGGGGKGGGASTGTAASAAGGGGGGGAKETVFPVSVIPGTTYTVTVGAGGAAGTAGAGGAGGDTTFKVQGTSLGVDIARFIGAAGGRTPATINTEAPGGEPMRQDTVFTNGLTPIAGLGGFGAYSGSTRRSAPGASHDGGGATLDNSQSHAADSGSFLGGGAGGGGGGGAGPDSSTSGVGGAGGAGNNAGAGGGGSVGTAGSAPGAGGGGGGGGGYGSTSGGAGGNGAAGAAGRLIIEWVE